MREELLAGLEYLEAVTGLLQRNRREHPTDGVYEAADLQWWWARPRPTDTLGQLFWFDDAGRAEAAVVITDWGDRIAMDPFLSPRVTPEQVTQIVERGFAHANELGFEAVELEIAQADSVLQEALLAAGFAVTETDFITEAWLGADALPEISPLHDNYRLTTRQDTLDQPHHNERTNPEMSQRLLQGSLYRPDLDLLVVDHDGNQASFGVFWYDPTTATGLVEPMRTEDAHQQRGLARHVLTAGVNRLAEAGAERIKIAFEQGNGPASHVYLSSGFQPHRSTSVFSRSARQG